MELFPEEIKDKTLQYGEMGDKDASQVRVAFKLFNPCGPGLWYVIEADWDDPAMMAFGYVAGLGQGELGEFSLKELSELRCPPLNLPIERDTTWDPETTLEDVMKGRAR